MTQKLKILLAFYHYGSRKAKGPMDMTTVTQDVFDEYRVSWYDPSAAIVPWKIELKSSRTEIDMWKKTLRPTSNDFTMHKLDEYWHRTKKQFRTTLQAMDLLELIDPNHVPADQTLYDLKMCWLF